MHYGLVAVLMLMIAHSSLTGERTDPPVLKQKLADSRLVAMMKVDYYSALLVTNRQSKWLRDARVKAASTPVVVLALLWRRCPSG